MMERNASLNVTCKIQDKSCEIVEFSIFNECKAHEEQIRWSFANLFDFDKQRIKTGNIEFGYCEFGITSQIVA
jgi:hypothetical protein